jgi:hypothetical protein
VAAEKKASVYTQGSEFVQLHFCDISLPHWIHDIAKEFLNVMVAEKSGQVPIYSKLNKTRKKKRGISR